MVWRTASVVDSSELSTESRSTEPARAVMLRAMRASMSEKAALGRGRRWRGWASAVELVRGIEIPRVSYEASGARANRDDSPRTIESLGKKKARRGPL